MHKCFSYPLKAENKEAFLHPGRLLGRGPQLYRAETLLPPSSLRAPHHTAHRPPEESLDFPSLPQPSAPTASEAPLALPHPSPHPPTSCPRREGKCAWVGGWMGRGHVGREQLSTWLAGVVTAWRGVCLCSCGLCHVVTGYVMVSVIR